MKKYVKMGGPMRQRCVRRESPRRVKWHIGFTQPRRPDDPNVQGLQMDLVSNKGHVSR
jgi:hypothetical protein